MNLLLILLIIVLAFIYGWLCSIYWLYRAGKVRVSNKIKRKIIKKIKDF